MANSAENDAILPVKVAAAVIVHDGRLLLVRRAYPEGDLVWQFPAGKVEPGETSAAAAVRETAEETGLTVVATSLLGERVHPSTGRTMVYFACEVIDGKAHAAAPEEVRAVVWCALNEIAAYVPYGFYEPVRQHLVVALSGLSRAFVHAFAHAPDKGVATGKL